MVIVDTKMKDASLKTILIDNSVFRNSVVVEPAQIKKRISWGNIVNEVNIVGFKQKSKLSTDQKWKQTQIECLPTIARLCRKKN
jgi:hypothetical protein